MVINAANDAAPPPLRKVRLSSWDRPRGAAGSPALDGANPDVRRKGVYLWAINIVGGGKSVPTVTVICRTSPKCKIGSGLT